MRQAVRAHHTSIMQVRGCTPWPHIRHGGRTTHAKGGEGTHHTCERCVAEVPAKLCDRHAAGAVRHADWHANTAVLLVRVRVHPLMGLSNGDRPMPPLWLSGCGYLCNEPPSAWQLGLATAKTPACPDLSDRDLASVVFQGARPSASLPPSLPRSALHRAIPVGVGGMSPHPPPLHPHVSPLPLAGGV